MEDVGVVGVFRGSRVFGFSNFGLVILIGGVVWWVGWVRLWVMSMVVVLGLVCIRMLVIRVGVISLGGVGGMLDLCCVIVGLVVCVGVLVSVWWWVMVFLVSVWCFLVGSVL